MYAKFYCPQCGNLYLIKKKCTNCSDSPDTLPIQKDQEKFPMDLIKSGKF